MAAPASPRLALVVGEFHRELMDAMLAAAVQQAREKGAEVVREVWVPGSYEVPLALSRLLGKPDVDGAVILGYIEKGETLHGEVMAHTVSQAVVAMAVSFNKPVGLGIIGPGATREQAEVRGTGYATRAVDAALSFFAKESSVSVSNKETRASGFIRSR